MTSPIIAPVTKAKLESWIADNMKNEYGDGFINVGLTEGMTRVKHYHKGFIWENFKGFTAEVFNAIECDYGRGYNSQHTNWAGVAAELGAEIVSK